MKILTRSNLIVSFLVVIFLVIGGSANSFAENALKSGRGYWDFKGFAGIDSHKGDTLKIEITVLNVSTDNSYRSGTCPNGMASCVVDWEIWHPDAGNLGSGQTIFQDVCNNKGQRIFEYLTIPAKYSELETRFNITTPNGGHSFKRGRTNWN